MSRNRSKTFDKRADRELSSEWGICPWGKDEPDPPGIRLNQKRNWPKFNRTSPRKKGLCLAPQPCCKVRLYRFGECSQFNIKPTCEQIARRLRLLRSQCSGRTCLESSVSSVQHSARLKVEVSKRKRQ